MTKKEIKGIFVTKRSKNNYISIDFSIIQTNYREANKRSDCELGCTDRICIRFFFYTCFKINHFELKLNYVSSREM